MTIDPMTAACLRYLSAPLAGHAPVPVSNRIPLAGVHYATPRLMILAAPHTMRLDNSQLERFAEHHDAEVAFMTWRRDGGISVDAALRVAGAFEVFRNLAPLLHENRLWLMRDGRRLWLTLGDAGLQITGRPPTTDPAEIAAGKARAQHSVSQLAQGAAHVRELRS